MASILVLATLVEASAAAREADRFLDDSLWTRRTILAFAPAGAPEIDELKAIVAARSCAVDDRDLDIFVITLDSIRKIDSDAPSLAGESPEDLRAAYAADDKRFEMVLIGKDGGIKARSLNLSDFADFFALIDTMPMRRAEIAERGPGCASNREVGPIRPTLPTR
ncbi:MAG: DUF4174 domain-containing protein [Ectothiorhodospiraceae bacterium AqS1]|nr:DUF4174 domain-containing protein [Ectothiorhodospiraceae bacterium AqS1]